MTQSAARRHGDIRRTASVATGANGSRAGSETERQCHPLLELQATAGNAAVAHLVAQRAHTKKETSTTRNANRTFHVISGRIAKPVSARKPVGGTRRTTVLDKRLTPTEELLLGNATLKVDLATDTAVKSTAAGPSIAEVTTAGRFPQRFRQLTYHLDMVARVGTLTKKLTVSVPAAVLARAVRVGTLVPDALVTRVTVRSSGSGGGDGGNPFGRFTDAPVIVELLPAAPLYNADKAQRTAVRQEIKQRLAAFTGLRLTTVVTRNGTKVAGLANLYSTTYYRVFGNPATPPPVRQALPALLPAPRSIPAFQNPATWQAANDPVHAVEARSHAVPNPKTSSAVVTNAVIRMHSGSERASLNDEMGASANVVAAALGFAPAAYEWLHMVAHRFGGADAPANLVLGTGDANTRMIEWEELVSRAVGARGTAHIRVTTANGSTASWLTPALQAQATVARPGQPDENINEMFEALTIHPAVQAAYAVAKRSGALLGAS